MQENLANLKAWALLPMMLAMLLTGCQKSSNQSQAEIGADLTEAPIGVIVQVTLTDQGVDVSDQATWASSNPGILQVVNDGNLDGQNPNGTVFTLAEGTATVTADYQGQSYGIDIIVTPASLESIELNPQKATHSINLSSQLNFRATAIYSDGTLIDITDIASWNSSNPIIAETSLLPGEGGKANLYAVGTTDITASFNEIQGSAVLDVTNSNPLGLQITPDRALAAALATADDWYRLQADAWAILDDGNIQKVTDLVTWSPPGFHLVSDLIGSKGQITVVDTAMMTDNITATLGALSATEWLIGMNGVLVGLQLDPMINEMMTGTEIDLRARALFNTTQTLAEVTDKMVWSSSDTNVATLCNAPGCKGRLTAVGPGFATITASIQGTLTTASFDIQVHDGLTLEEISVSPLDQAILPGSLERVKAYGLYSNGSQSVKVDLTETVRWLSSDESKLMVSNLPGDKGKLTQTSTGAGEVRITAKLDDQLGFAIYDIKDFNGITKVELDPLSQQSMIFDYQRYPLKLIATVAEQQVPRAIDVTNGTLWRSNIADMTISNAPGEKGLASNNAMTNNVSVQPIPTYLNWSPVLPNLLLGNSVANAVANFQPNPQKLVLPPGVRAPIQIGATFGGTNSVDLTQSVTFLSNAPWIADVSNDPETKGWVLAKSSGTAIITANFYETMGGMKSVAIPVAVTGETLQKIHLSPITAELSQGGSTHFSAIGEFKRANGYLRPVDLTASVLWESSYEGSNYSDLPISNHPPTAGKAVYRSQGNPTVTAKFKSKSASWSQNNDSATLTEIQVLPFQGRQLKLNSSFQLTAYGTYSDGSIRDLTDQVTWKTSNPNQIQVFNEEGKKGWIKVVSIVSAAAISAHMQGVSSGNAPQFLGHNEVASGITVTGESILHYQIPGSYKATASFPTAPSQDLTNDVIWSGTGPLSPSNLFGDSGKVSGSATGAGILTALDPFDGVASGNLSVTIVNNYTLIGLSSNQTEYNLVNGASLQASVTGVFSDLGAQFFSQDLTEEVVYESSDESVLRVSNHPGHKGKMTGLSTGVATVTVKRDLQTLSFTVNVF